MALPSPPRHRPPDGQAVSSVVAAILLVAIAIAMAAMVYAWASGLVGSFGSQPPSAELGVAGCNTRADAVTAELEQGGPLPRADLAAQLANETSGDEEARTDPLDSRGGPWEHQSRLTIAAHDEDEPNWDDPLASPGGLSPDARYRVHWVHLPSRSVFSEDDFTCDPPEIQDPTLEVVSCRAQNDEFTARLASDDPLDRPDWNATLYNATAGDRLAVADPLDDTGIWRPGQGLTFHEGTQGSGVEWDGSVAGGLEDGGTYRLELTHLASGEVRERAPFAC